MKELFKDILKMEGVKGVLLLSLEGNTLYKEFKASYAQQPGNRDWQSLLSALEGVREADVVYEESRIYMRQTGIGYLLVISTGNVSGAMLRLNCDILLPSLKPAKQGRSLKRFFKK